MVRKALPPISLTVPQKCFLDRRGYVIGDGISSGSFGAVYSATRYEEPSAVKVIAIDKLISKSQGTVNKCLPREIYLLKTLKHLNVIAVYDIYAIEKNLYIFMEKATGGDLDDFLFKNAATRGVFLPEGTCASYFFQVSQALAFMHSQGFSHRDIKGENVLLTGPKRELAKLADFGLARPIYDLQKGNQMNAKTWCGTMVFMAPEVLVIIPRKEFGKVGYCALKADVFSMGVMLYRLLNKNLPFYAPSIKDSKKLASTVVTKMQCEALLQQQAMSQSLKFHPGVSGEAINLVLAMLRNNPQERPTMEQVLKHTWHKTIVPESLQNLYTSGYSLDY